MPLKLTIGLKTDPIEYRYSFEWLFRIMKEEGVRFAQTGSFYELYRLPDSWFVDLRRLGERYDVRVRSMFTAHRELGGFFRNDPRWEQVAYKTYARAIEAGGILGAESVGSNPGATMRDEMDTKARGTACYVKNMKKLMRHARKHGVPRLAIEPMSCLAEPPTLPDEIRAMCEELRAYHEAHPDETSTVGCCTDISHGYADKDGNVVHGHMELLEAALPWTTEIHLKNTDRIFNSTFGFGAEERARGIVSIAEVRKLLLARAERIPVKELVGYIEMGGPKTGRDYSDWRLEGQLRETIRWCRQEFET